MSELCLAIILLFSNIFSLNFTFILIFTRYFQLRRWIFISLLIFNFLQSLNLCKYCLLQNLGTAVGSKRPTCVVMIRCHDDFKYKYEKCFTEVKSLPLPLQIKTESVNSNWMTLKGGWQSILLIPRPCY